jgi:protein SCO1/2
LSRAERTAFGALVFLAVVTAAWWALALWPIGNAAPQWLERARWVCFNAGPDGLPDASGWLLLIGQPIGMLAVLLAVWGDPVRAAVRAIRSTRAGRTALVACVGLLALGLVASGARVVSATSTGGTAAFDDVAPPDTYPRLDREAPTLSLTDQQGRRIGVEDLAGRPALVTFAFGNCETICPAIVRETLAVQEGMRRRATEGALAAEAVPRVVIVSLDPWRDTPGRLAHLAHHWKLGEDAHVLSGSVEEVETVLDAWNVARRRDAKTGDVTHPALVYILDASGAIAYATRGGQVVVTELLERV